MICNKCGEKIDDGYLVDEYYVYCNKCIKEMYTDKEMEEGYKDNSIFWTTFYDDSDYDESES